MLYKKLVPVTCCSFVSLKFDNRCTDLAYYDLELFVEFQGRFKQ